MFPLKPKQGGAVISNISRVPPAVQFFCLFLYFVLNCGTVVMRGCANEVCIALCSFCALLQAVQLALQMNSGLKLCIGLLQSTLLSLNLSLSKNKKYWNVNFLGRLTRHHKIECLWMTLILPLQKITCVSKKLNFQRNSV